jgi:hypothetical protein
MFRTVRIRRVACCIIADMVRIMAAFAAWAAGTAVAVAVTWFGANVVIRNAGVGPGIPVINAAVLPASATPAAPAAPTGPPGPPPASVPAPVPTAASRAASSPATATALASPAAPSLSLSPSASPTPTAGVRAYTLAGGRVTLAVTPTSVQLVTAVPDDGYAVQTWSGTGWLRVDFSSGPRVSSLIASWYEHAPAITVTN